MRPLLRWTLFFAAGYIISAALLSQQRFTSGTSLLILDVSVLDRDGNPVTDLGPEDLIVTLNGTTQPVRTMVFLTTQTSKANATTRGPGFPVSPSPAPPAHLKSEPDPTATAKDVVGDQLSCEAGIPTL
ncbi:MAG: hypothetical protein WD690_14025 [Vicinamibacterales bacterium]